MFLELATLDCSVLATGHVAAGARAWTADPAAAGTLLGAWRTELGVLGRVLVLRGFDTRAALDAERDRALRSDRPFGADGAVSALSMESHVPFPFLPPLRTGARGGIYEFRGYRQVPGGLPGTLAGWERALPAARPYSDALVTAAHALDGPPRIMHLWAFPDLARRAELRRDAYAAGTWPPPGGPDRIAEAAATIALPEPFSPLR